MKYAFNFLFLFAFSLLFISATYSNKAPAIIKPSNPSFNSPVDSIQLNIFATLSRKDLEKKIGRKLGLVERLAFKKAQKKIKKEPGWVFEDRKVPVEAVLSPLFSGMGFLFIVGTALSGFGCEQNCPGDGGIVIGIIGMIVGILIGIAALTKVSKDKEKWEGGFLAWFGIAIPLFFIFLLLLIVALA